MQNTNFKTKKDLENSKLFLLELSDVNYEAKYHLWTIQGHQFNNDSEQHFKSFHTIKEMLRWVNLVGVVKCSKDCNCK